MACARGTLAAADHCHNKDNLEQFTLGDAAADAHNVDEGASISRTQEA